MRIIKYIAVLLVFVSCAKNNDIDDTVKDGKILTQIPPEKSNVSFANTLNETSTENRFTYEYFYNGAGVGIGDINNDGLPDLYFCGNKVADKLYLNKGNFKFEDISKKAGISDKDGWSSGVNFADVNGDGFLDLYVSRSGPTDNLKDRENLLFINNKDITFTEQASQFGLASSSHSVQSAFFDYDLDGDLDMYLLNHPDKSFKSGKLLEHIDKIKSGVLKTDAFYENIDGRFVEKSKEAGLVSFGFRHGIAIGDLNNDGYPDLYISSDFDEPDLMYYNNGDKTFTNKINENLRHISNFSMGNEICDINNDGLNDIYVVDMTPADHVRSKLNMASMNPQKFFMMADNGFHHQYMVNTLQINQGEGRFSELAQLAGVAKTDWSWAPLFFDINLDGYKDLFVTNGIKRDVLNNDVRINAQNKMKELNRSLTIDELLDLVPTSVVPNYLYKNTGSLKFKDVSSQWMDNNNFNSNGASYADLDGDGDLDLIVNNVDQIASIYRNNSIELKKGNFIKLKLKGPNSNTFAIGTKVKVTTSETDQYFEVNNARGYLSSTDHTLCIGLGSVNSVETLEIIWPNKGSLILNNPEINKTHKIEYNANVLSNTSSSENDKKVKYLIPAEQSSLGIDFLHTENPYDDFATEILLPHKQSQNGPFISKGDVNGDGLDDFFIGGAKDQAGAIFIQNFDGQFSNGNNPVFEKDKIFEDLGSEFLDIDGDKDLDLFVTSGGNESIQSDGIYKDRLYINDGRGNFNSLGRTIPGSNISTQVVKATDLNNDGQLELFVGGRVFPGKYPYPVDSKIFQNQNGSLVDVTSNLAPELEKIGMVTDALFSDYDQDGDDDLFVVGEWTSVIIFENENGILKRSNNSSLEKTNGLWFSIEAFDYDQDGDEDYFVGNLGWNAKFQTGGEKELHIYSKDFDNSGSNDIVLSQAYKGNLVPVRGRECSSEQMPFIKEKFPNYQQFAEASIDEIFGANLGDALHYQADLLSSVVLKNNGPSGFEVLVLPNEAQFSPIMDFAFIDIDGQVGKEIIAVGNHFGAEVETVRYDASYGLIMRVQDGAFVPIPPKESGFYTSGNSKDIEVIEIKGKPHLFIANNNGKIDIFSTSNALVQ